MADETKPTRESVLRVAAEYDRIGAKKFLDKYEKGAPPERWLVRINGKLYPMKAISVAAHTPPVNPSGMDYRQGIRRLREVGFIDIVAVGEEDRPPIRRPTRATILRAMREFREIGTARFLTQYTEGNPPKSRYVNEGGVYYPLKALYAAAHTPYARHRHFSYRAAEKEITFLGFTVVGLRVAPVPVPPEISPELTVQEGKRVIKEVKTLLRHRGIVELAKAAAKPLICEACGFDFEKVYGSHGRGFIEAHHINPLNERDGDNQPTGIQDFAMLCANCHRMAHYGPKCLTVAELKALIETRS